MAKAPSSKPKVESESSEIAQAIAEGLAGVAKAEKEKSSIVIQIDPDVQTRFSLVRNKEGEVLIRENETGVLSRLQLQSVEEKQASLQNQEVTEI